MNIFISWSGDRSKDMAEALRIWLPRVIQSVCPWVSSHNLAKGSKWSTALSSELGAHVYGIICVTPENRDKPWILFEAGALSKTDASRTYTLLLGLGPADIEQPLAQFNHTLAEESDIRALVGSINEAGESPLSEDILEHAFATNWPYLKERFDAISVTVPPAPAVRWAETTKRDERSMIEEMLQLMRTQSAPAKTSQKNPSRETPPVVAESVREIVATILGRFGYKADKIALRQNSIGDFEIAIHLATGGVMDVIFPEYSSLDRMQAILRSGLDQYFAKGE